MNGVLLTAVLIVAVVAVIEGVTLFTDSLLQSRRENYYAVIPVISGDDLLRERLMEVTERTNADIILLDCGADAVQSEVCSSFCFANKNAVFLKSPELEKYFSDLFAINNKK